MLEMFQFSLVFKYLLQRRKYVCNRLKETIEYTSSLIVNIFEIFNKISPLQT